MQELFHSKCLFTAEGWLNFWAQFPYLLVILVNRVTQYWNFIFIDQEKEHNEINSRLASHNQVSGLLRKTLKEV